MAEQVSTLADLRPGDLGFGPISGIAGAGVRIGELLVAPFDHWPTWRSWRKVAHCGTVTEAQTTTAHTAAPGVPPVEYRTVGPKFAQAMPTGFEIVTMGAEHWTPEWIYLRPNYAPAVVTSSGMTITDQAGEVAAIARRMATKDIRYGFEDYAAIAAHRAGIHPAELDDFIARVDADGDPFRAICSQAVDGQLTLSGGLFDGHVFADGRLPEDVTPSELYLRLLELGCEYVFRPGVT